MPNLVSQFKQSLAFISITFTFLSCGQDTSSDELKSDPVTLAPEISNKENVVKIPNQNIPSGTERNDTIFISGNFILFYYPSDNEDQLLSFNNTQPPGFENMISEFKGMSKLVFDSLRTLDLPINSAITNSSNFCITMDEGNQMYFNRSSLKFPVGIIMMDGLQPPVIRSGNHTQNDYFHFIKSYFVSVNLENNNQNSSPSI